MVVHQISHWIELYGPFVVFVSVLIDLGGAPVPSYPVLLVAGALSLSGGANVPSVIAAGVAGAVVADLAWYFTGARLGSRVLSLICRFTLSPDTCVRQTQDIFTRLGLWALVVSKFVPGLGYVSVPLSGITGVSLPLFVLADTTGAILYVSLPVVLGRLFHNAVDSILATLIQLGEWGLAIVAGLFALYIAARWLERRAFARRLRMNRISVDELAGLIDGGTPPVIFDVRSSELRLREGSIPGAIAAHPSELAAILEAYPRDTDVVVYCSCPNEATAAVAALHLKRAGFKKIRPLLGGVEAWSRAGRALA